MISTGSSTRYYSVRRLSPFRGLLQVIEISGARALSVDGVNWQVQVQHKMRKPGWGSLDNVIVTPRYLRYGVWSLREGLSRLPLPPALNMVAIQGKAAAVLDIVRDMRITPPFPIEDRFEFWLLDANNRRPLALLSTAINKIRRKEIHRVEWFPLRPHDYTFTAPTKGGTETQELCDLMHRLVNKTAGKPARAQWFERDEEGAGIGLDDMHLDPSLVNRHLAQSEFPELPVREHWERIEERQKVENYHTWQAPLLLMLPQLTQTTRERLEQDAIDQPLTVHSFYRLYPKVIQQKLINKALVEAEFRKAATGSS